MNDDERMVSAPFVNWLSASQSPIDSPKARPSTSAHVVILFNPFSQSGCPMRLLVFTLLILSCGRVESDSEPHAADVSVQTTKEVVQVPRPNSGTYSTKRAEELLPSVLASSVGVDPRSELVIGWINPTHGIRVHLSSEGKITTQDWLGEESTGLAAFEDALDNRSGPLLGNPVSVLLTADSDGWNTPIGQEIVSTLFRPSIQLYVVAAE